MVPHDETEEKTISYERQQHSGLSNKIHFDRRKVK